VSAKIWLRTSNVMVFTKSYEDAISTPGYRYFDFETVGANTSNCKIAINQPLTGRKIRGTDAYGHTDW